MTNLLSFTCPILMVEVTQRVKAEPRSFFVQPASHNITACWAGIPALKSSIFNNEYNSFTQSSVSQVAKKQLHMKTCLPCGRKVSEHIQNKTHCKPCVENTYIFQSQNAHPLRSSKVCDPLMFPCILFVCVRHVLVMNKRSKNQRQQQPQQ